MTASTRSLVSLNFSGLAEYWASVRGAACFFFGCGLPAAFLAFGDGLLPGLFVAADDLLWAGFVLDDALLCTPLVRFEMPDGCFVFLRAFIQRTLQDLLVLYKIQG
jgi:hypothetical protein